MVQAEQYRVASGIAICDLRAMSETVIQRFENADGKCDRQLWTPSTASTVSDGTESPRSSHSSTAATDTDIRKSVPASHRSIFLRGNRVDASGEFRIYNVGVIKSLYETYGFIRCPEVWALYRRDAYLSLQRAPVCACRTSG